MFYPNTGIVALPGSCLQSFEKDCEKHEIHQYYLIRATNENADRFYKKFENVQLDEKPMHRKIMREEV